ncbi:MAG: helix-turn-helix domain-containing protein [Candidatus Coproplasma sp.]
MEKLNEKIAFLRKQKGLTQAQLGEKLNVTAQAVSKWETGLSEPDFQTAQRICDLFGITVDELLGRATPTQSAETASSVATQEAPHAEVTKIINGYCETCKKPVGPGEYDIETSSHTRGGSSTQHIYCKKCYTERKKARAVSAYSEHKSMMRRSFIWGGIAGAAALIIFLVSGLINIKELDMSVGAIIGISIFIGYAIFAFVTQMFWFESVTELFVFFLHSFKMPGVIFTLDLDGIIFLLLVKIGGAILSLILSVLVFLVGLIVTPLYAAVIFPFALHNRKDEGSKLRANDKIYNK